MQKTLEWFLRGAGPSKTAKPSGDLKPSIFPTKEEEEAARKLAKEKQDAKMQADLERTILNEYKRLGQPPKYTVGLLISPSLARNVRS